MAIVNCWWCGEDSRYCKHARNDTSQSGCPLALLLMPVLIVRGLLHRRGH